MFKVNDPAALAQAERSAEKNYVIAPNDIITLEVYTNNGERLVDPIFEAVTESGASSPQPSEPNTYVVDVDGVAKLPLLGELSLKSLTVRQAEELLSKEYAKYYKQPYVLISLMNKRVVVLGAPGGQVIPLSHENMKLTEVLALAGGLNQEANATNIRVLRDREVFLADLSTIDGYLKNDLIIQPGDIIYIEPVRKPFSEGLRDYGPLLSMITSIGTLIVVILRLNP